jgi:hypothetical protein
MTGFGYGGKSMRKRMLLLCGMIISALAAPVVANAMMPMADEQRLFRFELEQAEGPRGLAVEGYLYNSLPWRITNVRLRVESVDTNGAVTASASGWVDGDVKGGGGRAYFYVPVSSPAATYRATVQSFDKVAPETPRLEAP